MNQKIRLSYRKDFTFVPKHKSAISIAHTKVLPILMLHMLCKSEDRFISKPSVMKNKTDHHHQCLEKCGVLVLCHTNFTCETKIFIFVSFDQITFFHMFTVSGLWETANRTSDLWSK
ncbi:hypothetical protein AMECASPLE_032772 [Ameca splendens]|uniref:Uncharacterized protein n=1 Tax=Ameca splendens TaxID=208324 RepID=A0ABV0ZT08_9TELE